MAELTTCIGCGRRDTRHPSKLCGLCVRGHVQNMNADEDGDKREESNQITPGQRERDMGKRRTLPGPMPESEDE